MILAVEGVWVSALRLYFVKDGFCYIEALETHPDYRKRGYAAQLLFSVINVLKDEGSFMLCGCVHKRNTASLATHKKCGFKIVSDNGYDYLRKEADERHFGMQYEYRAL